MTTTARRFLARLAREGFAVSCAARGDRAHDLVVEGKTLLVFIGDGAVDLRTHEAGWTSDPDRRWNNGFTSVPVRKRARRGDALVATMREAIAEAGRRRARGAELLRRWRVEDTASAGDS